MIDYIVAMFDLAVDGDKQGFMFFICLYALVVCGYSMFFQLRVARWPETKGALLQNGVSKIGGTEPVRSNQEYVASALYEYVVDGTLYQGKRVSPWVMVASHNAKFLLERQMRGIYQYADGGVRVFFNPNNPKKSYLIKPGRVGIAFTLSLALGPMLLYCAAYVV